MSDILKDDISQQSFFKFENQFQITKQTGFNAKTTQADNSKFIFQKG